MKHSGKCPKCGGGEILFVPSHPLYEDDQFIRLEAGGTARRSEGISIHRYLCRDCGYVEQWVDEEGLKHLSLVGHYLEQKAQRWQKKQQEEKENRAYWEQKAAEQKERREQEKLLREQEKKRKNDPWN